MKLSSRNHLKATLENCFFFQYLRYDARPNPHFGTIELRICDLPGRFSDILALVALMQSLVSYIVEERREFQACSQQILRTNKWQAVRHGLNGTFIDPSGHLDSKKIPTRKAIDLLIKKVTPYSSELNSIDYLMMLNRILECGTNAEYQKKIYSDSGSFETVIYQTHQEFWQ